MLAASEGQLNVVKVLMENGADASLMDIDGDNAENFAFYIIMGSPWNK
jgi:ankyrin repeat protein